MPPTMTPEQARQWNAMDINQQISFLTYISKGHPDQSAVDKVIREWAETHFGALSAYLDHKELGPILLKAAREGWTPERLNRVITQTHYWHSTTESQRTWDSNKRSDPASAHAKVEAMMDQIRTIIANEGISSSFSAGRALKLANDLLRNGTVDAQFITKAVLAEAKYNPSTANGTTQPLGKLGATMTAIQSAADQYFTPISSAAAFDWAKQVEQGLTTPDAFNEYLRQQVQGQFSQDVVDRVNKGLTVRQVLDAQISRTAELLERDPSSLDFLDPNLRPIIQFNDGTGTRERTLAETDSYVRGLREYRGTTRAGNEAANLGEKILQTMGKVAG